MYKISSKHTSVYLTLEPFIEMLSSEQGLSINTINAYISDLSEYLLYLKSTTTTLEAVTQTHIENYITHLTQTNVSAKTQSRRLSAIKKFYAFLVSEGKVTENPTLLVVRPKQPQTLPKLLSEHDTHNLIMATYTTPHKDQLRRIVFIELLYATGIRISELLNIKINDIDWHEDCILITGKGNKQRLVPFTNSARTALQNYIKTLKLSNTAWLFPSQSAGKPLSRQRFFQLIKEMASDAGLDPTNISPHVIRHAFATHLLNNGANLMSIQKLLGHANISTTEIYTHVMTNKLKEAVTNNHPLSTKKGAF